MLSLYLSLVYENGTDKLLARRSRIHLVRSDTSPSTCLVDVVVVVVHVGDTTGEVDEALGSRQPTAPKVCE